MDDGVLFIVSARVHEDSVYGRLVLHPDDEYLVLGDDGYARDGTLSEVFGELVIEGKAWQLEEPPEGVRGVGNGQQPGVGHSSFAEFSRDWGRGRRTDL